MFDWFITVPGLLITSGIILLIITCIIFIKEVNKGTIDKENVKEIKEVEETKKDNIIKKSTEIEIEIPEAEEIKEEIETEEEKVDFSPEKEKSTIYGGNDPLEKTDVIETVERKPYGLSEKSEIEELDF